jgi:hypothetical protein
LVDTGAATNVIRSNDIDMELGHPIPLIHVDRTSVENAWKVKNEIGKYISGILFNMESIYCPHISYEMILGIPWCLVAKPTCN